MHVARIMTEKPVTILRNQTLGQALESMEAIGCHHLPVVSAEKHLVGMLSERDCLTALNLPYAMRDQWHECPLASDVLVRTVMTPAPIVIEPDTPADEAARLMLVNYIGCLPVMRGETLVGIVTQTDILMTFMSIHKRMATLISGSP